MIKLIILSVAFVFVLQFLSIICHKKIPPRISFSKPNRGRGVIIYIYSWVDDKIPYLINIKALRIKQLINGKCSKSFLIIQCIEQYLCLHLIITK